MGGDTFQGVQKLTNQEYITIVPELTLLIQQFCIKIEPYIPLPQKQVHGDIDFLVILKPQFNPKDIITHLKLEKYIINHNDTINSVYKNKQIDFFFPQSDVHFNTARFYKSYSGVGAFLGVFLPSKEVKLTTIGLYAIGFEKHIKFQYLITKDIPSIMKFYGLNYEQFEKGFETRQQLFTFLSNCRFLNEQQFVKHDLKHASKLTKFFAQYLKKKEPSQQVKGIKFQNPRQQALKYFKKQQQFEVQFKKLLDGIKRKRDVNDKFNATHVMQKCKISGKQFKEYKKSFREMFQSEQAYFQYIQNNEFQKIMQDFTLKCNIKEKQPKAEEKVQE